jgi:hypothetical protein
MVCVRTQYVFSSRIERASVLGYGQAMKKTRNWLEQYPPSFFYLVGEKHPVGKEKIMVRECCCWVVGWVW